MVGYFCLGQETFSGGYWLGGRVGLVLGAAFGVVGCCRCPRQPLGEVEVEVEVRLEVVG